MRMCPISGMVQFLIVVVMLLLLCHAVVVKTLNISFTPNKVNLSMYDSKRITYQVYNQGDSPGDAECYMYSIDPNVAFVEKEIILARPDTNYFTGAFNVTGNFLGKTAIVCKNKLTGELADRSLEVVVVRKKRLIDTVFTASVATLVSILYINFGCALDWSGLGSILKRPIGPTIGFCGQFIVMPVLSYVIGKILFPDSPEMQLGMFFTGVSPAGGASNVWAVLLEGNISLSIIMTTISTIAAFAMMPFWLFTLGQVIFESGNLEVPYQHITTYVVALVVPLAIGYLLQRYLKRVAQFMTRIIKGFSSCLILFIIVFAIVTNLYLFQLFSWKIVVAGMALPWLGYVSGYLIAKLLKQPPPDCLTIAIEVGIQNTGIAIFLLRFALPQPQADLTTVAPVAVAIMTPFPLMFVFLYKKIQARLSKTHVKMNGSSKILPKTDNNCNGDVDCAELLFRGQLLNLLRILATAIKIVEGTPGDFRFKKMYFKPTLGRLGLFLLIISLETVKTDSFTISFTPKDTITIPLDDFASVEYNITLSAEDGDQLLIYSLDEGVASLEKKIITAHPQADLTGSFNVSGNFLGQTSIVCRNLKTNEQAETSLKIVVVRKHRVIDTVFTISVAVLVSIIYINFGCAINWWEFPVILKRPFGPIIGMSGQFILMPLLSYGLGQILFPDNPEMQLGIFFTGVAPAGGASNLWAVLLNGNLSLSIIMTTISTVAAFGMMPLWIFTLGKLIFDKGKLEVPYLQITMYVMALIVPLTIGFLIRKYFKRFAKFMESILKGFSVCLILFIIVFATATNLYLFKLFSWKIIIAGMALPWIAYVLGYLVAQLFRQPHPDCLTIAIEIVAPVSVAILTPFPLMFLYVCLKIKSRFDMSLSSDFTHFTINLIANIFVFINIVRINGLTISFVPNPVTLHMDETATAEYNITGINSTSGQTEFLIYTEDQSVAKLEKEIILVNPEINSGGSFNITGVFLGQTRISCKNLETNELAEGSLSITVIRKQRVVDRIFNISVAVLVSIIYINFGCAINWSELPVVLKKPIGPAIGFCGQFILMPLLSYGLGQVLFPGNAEMQLGMFFAGVAPGGGASNIWTVLLEGNVSLSIIMTTISTVAAFGMMPLWIFTLGKVIFDSGNLDVPYTQITTYVVGLIIPLGVGFLMQRYLKRFADFMKRILKGFSVCLILFIIVFAIVTNLYLFQLFSWQIVVAGMALPWLGYTVAYLSGMAFRQPSPDCITIAVEVGIQNTVVPVSVAILTPFPLIFLYIFFKIRARFTKKVEIEKNISDLQER
ncbi:hypothetical protein NQ315_011944 [Exocentrus adspersus]|uniref:Ileal sodium/bile acid cotransporter n=1 Tax=Exocentrus adspersus TaxID=1586481 RepID=A0AAV8W1B4_9CUCU|nr:hypothetical protein NQ315_011944 [Exocentrus adspersus]